MASDSGVALAAKQEELLKNFASAEGDKTEVEGDLLKIISDIALSGSYVHDWPLLVPLFAARLKQIAAEFNSKSPDCPDKPGESWSDITEKLVETLEDLPSAPFTVQRMCEVLWEPHRQYRSTKKLLGSLDRILNVSSTKEKADPASRVIPPPRPVSKPRDAPSQAPPSLLAAIRDSGGLIADASVNEEGPATFDGMDRSPEKAAVGAGGGGGGGSPGADARSPPSSLPLSPRTSPGSGGLPVEDTGLASPPPSPPKAATMMPLSGSPKSEGAPMSWSGATEATSGASSEPGKDADASASSSAPDSTDSPATESPSVADPASTEATPMEM